MRQTSQFLSFTTFILQMAVLLNCQPSEGSLLPFIDYPQTPIGTVLPGIWSDRFVDPFKVLEHIPLELQRHESIAISPTRVDWKEMKDGHVIVLDVPGLKKDELKIEVEENRVLRVSGERKREEDKKGDHWHRVERYCGKFWRQFRLPENVDIDSINAKLENGVLAISFAKLSPDRINGPRPVGIVGGGVEVESLPKLQSQQTKEEL